MLTKNLIFMMNLDEFLGLTYHGKKLYYEKSIRVAKSNEIPFWMERIQTAIEKNAPLCVAFLNIPELINFYWDYKNELIKKAI